MNRLAVSTGFLGGIKNRFMQYQENRTLEAKFELASRIERLDGLEACYPGDFDDYNKLKELLDQYGLGVASVNFRSRRTGKWWRGSFTSNVASERQELVDDCRRAMDYASDLGCNRISTCPLNDGHDYPFEMAYDEAYGFAEEAFARVCEHNPEVKVCIEYKLSDPRARCFLGTAGETLSFCQTVGAQNLGITLDFGHAIYGGERPAQVVCMLARAGRLFYVHLNDNDRCWDWDMIPGAYHLWEFVEFFYYLDKMGYTDDWYAYDVFPKELDTVESFTTSLALTRKLEEITSRIDQETMEELLASRNPSQTMPYLFSLI